MGDVLDRPKLKPARDNKGHYLPGQSGNPGGASKGFKGMAAYIRKKTRDGEELADFALGVFRNEGNAYKHVDRWAALQWLADRGFGKAVNTLIEIAGGDSSDVPNFDGVDKAKLAELDKAIGDIISQAQGLQNE